MSFFRSYRGQFPTLEGKTRVLEVGSKSYREQDTYRSIVEDDREIYTGLDLEAGKNVDIVPSNPYVWEEIADASFDVCISGQTFEHNPFFWVTACEIARVLVPGGYTCIIAPGGGQVHRFPVDCYRYYPDSWAAIAALAGLEISEVYFETDEVALRVKGGRWRDSMLIARKPLQTDEAAARRRQQVVQPFKEGFGSFEAIGHKYGPAVEDYVARTKVPPLRAIRQKVGRRISPFGVLGIYRG
ncbi:methyltransferase domain-containing protein [Sphingomonas gilva]|nr:methyltransferase domain-containing protein [Sphingomonas gilva]